MGFDSRRSLEIELETATDIDYRREVREALIAWDFDDFKRKYEDRFDIFDTDEIDSIRQAETELETMGLCQKASQFLQNVGYEDEYFDDVYNNVSYQDLYYRFIEGYKLDNTDYTFEGIVINGMIGFIDVWYDDKRIAYIRM